jgi:hypothetical protein
MRRTRPTSATFLLPLLLAKGGCAAAADQPARSAADPGARFVRFALALEAATGRQYDIDYWGPDEVQAEAVALGLSVEAVADSLRALQSELEGRDANGAEGERLAALRYRTGALLARIDVLQGAEPGFENVSGRSPIVPRDSPQVRLVFDQAAWAASWSR